MKQESVRAPALPRGMVRDNPRRPLTEGVSMRRSMIALIVFVSLGSRALAQCPSSIAAPDLKSPVNTNLVENSPVSFNWTAASASGVTGYEVLLASTTAAAPIACSVGSGATSCTGPVLAPGSYSWMVRTKTTSCTSGFNSDSKQFQVGCPSAIPLLQTPAPGALNVATTPTYTWSAVGGADQYDLYLGPVGAGCVGSPVATASTNSFNLPALQPGTAYEWRVAAKRSGTSCPALVSSCSSFRTAGTGCTAPGNFSLTAPGSNAVTGTTPTLSWTAASGAAKYQIHLGTANPPQAGATDPLVDAISTSYTPSALPPGTYFWSVDAFASCSTTLRTSSNVSSFTTQSNCPTGNATPLSPSAGAHLDSTRPIAFTWSAVSSADSFDLLLSSDASTFNSIARVSGGVTSFTVNSLPAANYIWLVRANFSGGCPSTLSAKSSFAAAIPAATCPSAAPALRTPPNNATGVPSPVLFDWDPVPGATSYRLVAVFSGGSPVTLAVLADTEYLSTVPAGGVEWWVEASAVGCPAVASSHLHFTAVDTPATCTLVGIVVDLLAPADGASGLVSPVTFRWTGGVGTAGTSEYRVWGIANGTAPFLIGSIAGASQLTASVPQGALTWFVEARVNGGLCPSFYSKRQTINVATGATCNGSATTLISPANKATAVASPVQFRWTAVTGAIGYKLFTSSGSTSGDLAGFTTETTLSRLVPDGTVSWWVDTMFVGCPDVRSSIFQFTAGTQSNCGGGSITLTKPTSGAIVNSPVALAWSAVSGATSYRIWVSFDGQTAEVIAKSSDAAASIALPSGTIEWYVEAQFSNCPSIFSPHARFTVSKGAGCDLHKAVTLVSPAVGEKRDSPVDFQWIAADPASLYQVWISLDSAPFTPVGVTRGTHLQIELPPGDGKWFVESFFEGCPPVVSATGRFTVTPPTCGADAPTLISPAPGASNISAPVPFVWSAVPGAIEYRVLASLDGGDMAVIDKTSGTSTTRPLPPGTYVWQVVAVFEGCPAGKSAKARFTVPRSANCGVDVPQLVSPSDGAATVASPVTLNWNPVSGAVAYVVFVRHADGAPTRLAETLDTQVTRHLPEGQVEWWVAALFQACPPAESKHSTFSIPIQDACDHRQPLLLAPAQGAASLVSPVTFAWTAVAKATAYRVWAGVDGQDASVVGTTAQSRLTSSLPAGIVRWYVEATFDSCPSVHSSVDSFAVLKSPPPCSSPARPQATAPGQVASGTPFTIRWSAVANATSYELQESATADFSAATTLISPDLAATFTHISGGSPQRWRYRVRAISNCGEEPGRRSTTVSVVVLPEKPQESTSIEAGAHPGVSQTIFIPGQNPPVAFNAKTDKPWASVSPSSGTLGPAGMTLTVTTDATALKLGSNKASVILTYPSAKVGTRGVTPVTTVPVSVSLVTPVSSGGKTTPPPDSLIVPVVGHLSGANGSQFQSDVRVANTSAQPAKYQLNLTLTGTDGTQSGQSTSIQVDPGATMALDDILGNFFGIGTEGSGATGMLEIRPLTSSASTPQSSSSSVSIQTVASSRTYTTSAQGTFGQYIPAISLSQFIEKPSDTALSGVLTLQHLAQSAAYRTNLGLVEGAGESANVLVHVFNNAGTELTAVPLSLMPGEHKQLNYFLLRYGVAANDARIEIEVTSSTGRVSAYASVIDNLTNDPLLVPAVVKAATTATQYVVPTVADAVDGTARSRSDLRIYNSGSAPINATLLFTPENNGGAPVTSTLPAIAGGEVRALDDVVNSVFGKSNIRGSIAITTATASTLVVTSRTYTQTGSGTYGQFVPAVSAKDSSGAGERVLQLVQLEQSARYSTDIGVVETSGKPATVEVSVLTPDSKVAPKTSFTLAANGTQRLALAGFGLSSAYNVRVTVKVLSGSGRVSAYGSVADQQTHDTTFVPAQ